MKKRQVFVVCICFSLLLTSCANGKKKKGFILRNTLSSELSQSISKICAKDQMDEQSRQMIPVNGFDRKSNERVKQNHIDKTIDSINFPVSIFLDSFFNFNRECSSTPTITLKELRTYDSYNGYGMGVYGVSYKVEAIVEKDSTGSNSNRMLYSAFSKTESLGMFSSSKKSVDYQSAALTSAFYRLYQKVSKDVN